MGIRYVFFAFTSITIKLALAQEDAGTPYQMSPDECRLAITTATQREQDKIDAERTAYIATEKARVASEEQAAANWEVTRARTWESAKYI